MREVTGWRATDFVATMTHPQAEYPYGITLPGMAGMFTRLYMEKYGVTREHLLAVSLKNQEMGTSEPVRARRDGPRPNGIFDSPHSVVNNPVSADPLHLYDLCPVSDGAAALVLSHGGDGQEERQAVRRHRRFRPGHRHPHPGRARRPDRSESRHPGGAKSLSRWPKLKPSDVTWPNCTMPSPSWRSPRANTSAFFKKGEGGKAAAAGKTRLGGQIPINLSGGLKARGHPVGGTGVAQIVDIVWQLRHELPENRQVKNAEVGLTVNFGGFGNNVLCFILRRVQP